MVEWGRVEKFGGQDKSNDGRRVFSKNEFNKICTVNLSLGMTTWRHIASKLLILLDVDNVLLVLVCNRQKSPYGGGAVFV